MSECHRIAERLAAYADESLPVESGADVERHHPYMCIVSHGGVARAGSARRASRSRGQPSPGAAARPALAVRSAGERARPRPGAPAWRGRVVLVAVAAILVAFTGVAIASLATQRSAALLAGQLTADHTRCFGSFVSPDPCGLALQEVEASHVAREVEASLAAQYGREIHLPPSSSAARKSGEIMGAGHRSLIWTRGETTFVLVASVAAGELDGAIRYVMEEAY